MFTANDCPRAMDILHHKTFEPSSMQLWCRLARTATSIVDVGAQVGIYSLTAAALRSDIPIHALEPNPYAYARLRIHKNINGFHNIVEHCVAAVSKAGISRLSWNERGWISSGAALFKPEGSPSQDEQVQNVLVEAVRLDDILEGVTLGERPLVKIDVEGAEWSALKGMLKVLEAKPDLLIETFSADFCEHANKILLPLGYQVWTVDEDAMSLCPADRLKPADRQTNNFNQFLSVRGLS